MCFLDQTIDWISFEKFFSESFSEGQSSRELRLSMQERDYILSHYPFVQVSLLNSEDSPKSWYLVTIGNRDRIL